MLKGSDVMSVFLICIYVSSLCLLRGLSQKISLCGNLHHFKIYFLCKQHNFLNVPDICINCSLKGELLLKIHNLYVHKIYKVRERCTKVSVCNLTLHFRFLEPEKK